MRKSSAFAGAAAIVAMTVFGCSSSTSDSDATATITIQNQFAAAITPVGIYKVSYAGTTFDFSKSPLASGTDSPSQTVTAGTGPAYALVLFGWTPGTAIPATATVEQLDTTVSAPSGTSVPVVFSFSSITGKCSTANPLTKDEYNQIAKTYFPNDKVDDYDTLSCAPPPSADAGASDASTD